MPIFNEEQLLDHPEFRSTEARKDIEEMGLGVKACYAFLLPVTL